MTRVFVSQLLFSLISLGGFFPVTTDLFVFELLLLNTSIQTINLAYSAYYTYSKREETLYRFVPHVLTRPAAVLSAIWFFSYLRNSDITRIQIHEEYPNAILLTLILSEVVLLFKLTAEANIIDKHISILMSTTSLIVLSGIIFDQFAKYSILSTIICILTYLSASISQIAYTLKDNTIIQSYLELSFHIYAVIVSIYIIAVA